VPVLELVLRGTLVYWLLFCPFRFVLRRPDAAQNAMAGGYQTVSEGAISTCWPTAFRQYAASARRDVSR